MCGCWGNCSARRCVLTAGKSCSRPSNACARSRKRHARTIHDSTSWPRCWRSFPSNPPHRSRARSRIFSTSPTSPSSTIASGAAVRISRIRMRVRRRDPVRRRSSGWSPEASRRRRLQAAHRAGAHRASHRSVAADADPQVQPRRRAAGRARPRRSHDPRTRRGDRRAAARNRVGLGDRRSSTRSAITARRGARRVDRLRGESVARGAGVSARRRCRVATRRRPRAPAGRRAHSLRVVDWRRPRRQPERDAGGDTQGMPPRAMAGRRPLSRRGQCAARRAVDVERIARAEGVDRRCARALSRAAARSASASARDARLGGSRAA